MATQVTSKERLNGFVLGVEFKNGSAETDSPTALAFFRQSEGYTVADEKPAKKAAGSSSDS
jgi:hypothetical protein